MMLVRSRIKVLEDFITPFLMAIFLSATHMIHQKLWSLDLTTQDEDGRYWDFTEPEMRNRAARKVLQDKPVLFIGSPMCTVYSTMNHINHAKMPRELVNQRFREARKHLEFCVKLYNLQWEAGRYFLHEHPEGASSWQEHCILKMLC